MQEPTCGVPMLLWAAEAHLVPEHGNVVHWQGTVRATGTRSLTQYIEVHAEEVRQRYLAWFSEFGEIDDNGRRLRERLKLADVTSFWWHSVFVEQSPWKLNSLEALLKLFAFELMLAR